MFCPACGSAANSAQKFCRACGLNLDGLAERVALHQGTMSVTKNRFDQLLTRIGMWMAISGGGLFILMMLFAIISSAFDLVNNDTTDNIGEKVLAIALPLVFFGIGLFSLPHILRHQKSQRQLSPQAPQAVTTAELAPPLLPTDIASVSEATTRHLEPVEQKSTSATPSSERPKKLARIRRNMRLDQA